MSSGFILIVILIVLLVLGGGILWFLFMENKDIGGIDTQIETLMSSTRQTPTDPSKRKMFFTSAGSDEEEGAENKSELTLEKMLKYAQWKISPFMFRVWQVLIGIFSFIVGLRIFDFFFAFWLLFLGVLVMDILLEFSMERRFNSFDKDYPQFLLSLVGLLKTGMNTLTSLESSAEGLEQGAMVREEVSLMIERLRFGVSEERSVGSFGEDINHPEIELFVQALLLNKRLGGNLSDTLDRLAKQVRKRQYFRQAAKAAIGLQRGSLWFIICILIAIEFYLYIVMPETVVDTIADPMGWLAWQSALFAIAIGILWLRKVTKIRV